MEDLKKDARNFLIELIETPSFSREEENTALIIEKYLKQKNIPFQRKMNNIWAKNLHFDAGLPTILLNSHHDTVKPNSAYTKNPFEALEMQEDLQKKYTGGTVLHLYMNEAISSPELCRDIVRRALTRFRLPYITITPTFSVCPKHGYIPGNHEFCPKCDAELIAKKKLDMASNG